MTAKPRATWMDTLRGTAIVLVVLWHAPAVLRISGMEVPPALLGVNEVFASYRMPMLMLLSGLLLSRSLAKPLISYAVGKLRHILWPLLVWGVLNYALGDQSAPIYNKVNWTTPYLWFLFYLLVFYAVAPLIRFLPAALPVMVAFAATLIPGLSSDQRRFFFLAGFFFLGSLLEHQRDRFEAVVSSPRVWWLLPPVVVFSTVFAVLGPWRYHGLLAVFSCAGILLLIKAARLPFVEAHSSTLQFVGRESLVFYCTHFPVLLGVAWLARRLGLPVGATVLLGVVATLAVGVAAAWLARRTPVSLLFTFPAIPLERLRPPLLEHPALRRLSATAPVAAVQRGIALAGLGALAGFGVAVL